jgi:transposase
MENASFYDIERIEQMCAEAGVKLLYLPLYSPDINPIEASFAEIKAFNKKQWNEGSRIEISSRS